MKKILGIIASVFAVVFVASMPAHAADSFSFKSFDADYHLTRDENNVSHLTVDETLVAQFDDYGNNNHGIERALPQKYMFSGSSQTQSHSFNLQIDSVNDQYATRTENGMKIIRIGNPDKYVHGEKTYRISWSASNVTRNFDDGDEFYWDVNGDGWSQRFDSVTARVHIPADLVSQLNGKISCWAGSYGSTSKNCQVTESDENGGRIYTFASSIIVGSGETLTFDIGFKPNTFAKPKFDPAAVTGLDQSTFYLISGAIITLLIASVVILILVIAKGRPAKTGKSIIPEYLPPKGLSVTEATQLWPKSVKFFPAAIIDLAVRGYVRIYEVEGKRRKKPKDYGLEIMRIDDDLLIDDRAILNAIFENVQPGETRTMKSFRTNTASAMELQKIPPAAKQRLWKDYGYYKTTINFGGGIMSFATVLVFGSIICATALQSWLPVLAVIPAIVLFIAAKLFNPLSLDGQTALEYLRGLEMYMKIGEAERLKVLQTPAGAEKITALVGSGKQEVQVIKLYERLMPYAVIFGITKQWSKALQVHYESDPSLVPSWYLGVNLAAFSAANFASAIDNFSSASYVSGAGSAASGGSGFSGGGFAGGGGGGGGGGGW